MSVTLPSAEIVARGAFELADGRLAFLAQANDVFPHINQLLDVDRVTKSARFEGTPDEFLELFTEKKARQTIKKRLKNKVRKCPSCGKAVAFTLPNCNGCGQCLKDVDITFTNNVFTGFIYGVKKGPFPFTISTRFQDADFLVFDDLLALSPCHINCIPTSQYMADWRYLLRNPAKGLQTVSKMHELCTNVLQDQFYASEEWRSKLFKDKDLPFEELQQMILSGFNFPPSQYQLHLQFMVLPLIPFQYFNYLEGLHMTPGRFFPVQYVRAVLSLNIPYPVEADTPIEDIIAFYKEKGVDYKTIHEQFYANAATWQAKVANWQAKDFDGVLVGKEFHKFTDDEHTTVELACDDADAKEIAGKDKMILQNYGRPYKEGGRPNGSYYKRAKRKAEDMEDW